eukprot:gene11797-biopygen2687
MGRSPVQPPPRVRFCGGGGSGSGGQRSAVAPEADDIVALPHWRAHTAGAADLLLKAIPFVASPPLYASSCPSNKHS